MFAAAVALRDIILRNCPEITDLPQDIWVATGADPGSCNASLLTAAGTGGSGNAMPQTGWRDKGQLARLEYNWPIAYNLWKSGSLEQPASIGGTGLSSEQIKQLSTYAGWSLNANPAGDSIWYIKDGISAPTLQP